MWGSAAGAVHGSAAVCWASRGCERSSKTGEEGHVLAKRKLLKQLHGMQTGQGLNDSGTVLSACACDSMLHVGVLVSCLFLSSAHPALQSQALCQQLPFAFNVTLDCKAVPSLPNITFTIGGSVFSVPVGDYAYQVGAGCCRGGISNGMRGCCVC